MAFGRNLSSIEMSRLTFSLSFSVTSGQTSCKYFSLYFGKSVANADSSKRPCGLSSFVNVSSFQWSIPS